MKRCEDSPPVSLEKPLHVGERPRLSVLAEPLEELRARRVDRLPLDWLGGCDGKAGSRQDRSGDETAHPWDEWDSSTDCGDLLVEEERASEGPRRRADAAHRRLHCLACPELATQENDSWLDESANDGGSLPSDHHDSLESLRDRDLCRSAEARLDWKPELSLQPSAQLLELSPQPSAQLLGLSPRLQVSVSALPWPAGRPSGGLDDDADRETAETHRRRHRRLHLS